MGYQHIFKRYEQKYLLSAEQKAHILQAIDPFMDPDPYGKTTIRNLYFDTETYRLIRRSIEKPVTYKEKLRVRCYRRAEPGDTVFVELKKKYKHVVYKRRLSLPEEAAMDWLLGRAPCPQESQIAKEIQYFLQYYKDLRPAAFLSYEREAFYSKEDPNFRITFDTNVLCRAEDLSLGAEVYGRPLLPEGIFLMEIKSAGGMPLWMARLLSEEKIYKTSFSKYGTAYRQQIYPTLKKTEELTHA